MRGNCIRNVYRKTVTVICASFLHHVLGLYYFDAALYGDKDEYIIPPL